MVLLFDRLGGGRVEIDKNVKTLSGRFQRARGRTYIKIASFALGFRFLFRFLSQGMMTMLAVHDPRGPKLEAPIAFQVTIEIHPQKKHLPCVDFVDFGICLELFRALERTAIANMATTNR